MHGRGLTDSSLTKWIHAFPQCIPICDILESFANIHIRLHLNSTCQLRVISQRRDHDDFATFLQWFKVHSPFTFSQQTCVCVLPV